MKSFLDKIKYNEKGLVTVITQQYDSKEVLMLAWANKEALEKTIKTKKACYFSRSRNKLWEKGESSGQTQEVKEIRVDCDSDAVLFLVDQKGVACHTGHRSCFYRKVSKNKLIEVEKIKISEDELYNK
jgi:phosphoribosyl-AMP cyclohydrolase